MIQYILAGMRGKPLDNLRRRFPFRSVSVVPDIEAEWKSQKQLQSIIRMPYIHTKQASQYRAGDLRFSGFHSVLCQRQEVRIIG